MNFTRRLAAVALCGVLSACVSGPRGVAPSTTPLEPGSYTELEPVEVTYCEEKLVAFIRLNPRTEIRNLIREAIAKVDGATALTDVTFDTHGWNIIFYKNECTTLRGTAVKHNPV